MSKLRHSRILREMRDGELSSCYKLNLYDSRAVEIVAASGISAVWLCNEHTPNDWYNLEHQIRAAALHDTDALVRVSKSGYSDYIRPLEAGAAGIIIPHVKTADEARTIVEWIRFMPLGKRPIDGGNVDGLYGSIPLDEYVAFHNRERVIILQIESPEALENVEEIAAVDGFDLLMFGPGDYTHLIGKLGAFDDKEVNEARLRVERAARANGKHCFGVAVKGTSEELLERGYAVVNIGSDVLSLGAGVKESLQVFNQIDAAEAEKTLYENH